MNLTFIIIYYNIYVYLNNKLISWILNPFILFILKFIICKTKNIKLFSIRILISQITCPFNRILFSLRPENSIFCVFPTLYKRSFDTFFIFPITNYRCLLFLLVRNRIIFLKIFSKKLNIWIRSNVFYTCCMLLIF